MGATNWLLVGTRENYEKSASLGWTIAGIKGRHRKKAERMRPGDPIIFYLTRLKAFGGIVTIDSPYFEDDTPIWLSEKPGEQYPFRVRTRPDIILPLERVIPAQSVVADLEYTRRWPAEHWTLAFQGNVHVLNDADYTHLRGLIAARAGLVPA
jgi:hypothetical protein